MLTVHQAFAVGLKGVSCGNGAQEVRNYLLNGGCKGKGDNRICGIPATSDKAAVNMLNSRCRMVEADAAFLFLGFIASIAAAVLCFLASRRSGGRVRHSAV